MNLQVLQYEPEFTPILRHCLIGLRCLAGVYPGPVVPSPPVDRRPVEDIEQEEEHLDYYRH